MPNDKASSSAAKPSVEPTDTTATATANPIQPSENSNSQRTTDPPPAAPAKPYTSLVHEAIVALKERTGSSLPALHKYILAHHPHLDGPHFKARVMQAIKGGIKTGRFQKVKASYKINAKWKERSKKKKQQQKKKKTLQETKELHAKRLQQLEQTLTPEDLAKAKLDMKQKEAAALKRAEAIRKAKERAERLRKRRFPMEDTKLHLEDKELGVKTPADVKPRPYLPYFWNLTLPLNDPARKGKTSWPILQASKVDHLHTGSPGLVPDLLQVYHFFRGDVHFTGPDPEAPMIPEFTLSHLVFAVEQVLNGNAKKARLVPPLLVHLFCTCLDLILTTETSSADDNTPTTAVLRKLRNEFREYLVPALTPTSWADVCFLYMDAMERYYSTDASRNPQVVSALQIDLPYLLGVYDQPMVPQTPAKVEEETPLPEGYCGYLGDAQGVLAKAHQKLGLMDPWHLTAEELMALLRALTDDVLATHPAIASDMERREEQMMELKRNKRNADIQFRKVQLAFEGPKKTKKNDDDEQKEEEEEFKPTATRKQFEAARKAQQKASDAYEKGIRKLVARTEPIGYDRNFNAVYCFRHDPQVLYIEDVRPPSSSDSLIPREFQIERRSWHVIESTSLFDLYTASLDIRGRREHDLYEELMGPEGTNQSLRRFLLDDVKEKGAAAARIKEREELLKRLESARFRMESGRGSARLAGTVEEELSALENELDALEQRIQADRDPEHRDYGSLTGLELLQKFDQGTGVETRRSRERRDAFVVQQHNQKPCSKLCSTGNIDGTGIVGMLVADLLKVEELCEFLAPWDQKRKTRSQWIANLEESVSSWNLTNPVVIGSPEASWKYSSQSHSESPRTNRRNTFGSVESSAKKPKIESPSPTTAKPSVSVPTIINQLKQPLIDLEERVAEITNLAMVSRDAQIADDNMSTDGSDQDEDEGEKERQQRAWRKMVSRIRQTPTSRHGQIRELLASAISAARRAHLPDVMAKLREALLLYRPNAAFESKSAAIKVLEEYGGYDDEDEDDEELEGVEEEQPKDSEISSVLAAEAVVLASSLGGTDDASRSDWIQAVKDCKTLSRLSSLASSFCKSATERLKGLENEHEDLLDAIKQWEKDEDRRAKGRVGRKANSKEDLSEPSEVWANVQILDEICMAKIDEWPWWPARKCVPKDPDLAKSLSKLNRELVALVGEMGGIRVVKSENVRPFTGSKDDDDLSGFTKEIRHQLNDCMAMARRVVRGLEKESKTNGHCNK